MTEDRIISHRNMCSKGEINHEPNIFRRIPGLLMLLSIAKVTDFFSVKCTLSVYGILFLLMIQLCITVNVLWRDFNTNILIFSLPHTTSTFNFFTIDTAAIFKFSDFIRVFCLKVNSHKIRNTFQTYFLVYLIIVFDIPLNAVLQTRVQSIKIVFLIGEYPPLCPLAFIGMKIPSNEKYRITSQIPWLKLVVVPSDKPLKNIH